MLEILAVGFIGAAIWILAGKSSRPQEREQPAGPRPTLGPPWPTHVPVPIPDLERRRSHPGYHRRRLRPGGDRRAWTRRTRPRPRTPPASSRRR
jgi:hypothetical protein